MVERHVTATRKPRGEIEGLCGGFGYVSRLQAVAEINRNPRAYYVLGIYGQRVYVHVYAGVYLRTNRDEAGGNNLDNLPHC